jgi:SsrA-binding protein
MPGDTAGTSVPNSKLIAENPGERGSKYAIEDNLECGIMLDGCEVKSLRQGHANISESYASLEDGELWLINSYNSYIAPYSQSKRFGHEEQHHRRKLLMSKKQLARLFDDSAKKGMTRSSLRSYLNDPGIGKLKSGIAKGKKLAPKRATEDRRDWDRQKATLLKEHG